MKKKLGIGIGIAVLTVSTGALAGAVYNSPVVVFSNVGSGSIATARYSSDGTQQIGCEVYAEPNSTTYVYCWAADSSDHWIGCYTYDNTVAVTAAAVGPNSFVEFTVASNGYNCASVIIENSSPYVH